MRMRTRYEVGVSFLKGGGGVGIGDEICGCGKGGGYQ
jgi:hypothetical protein